MKKSNFLILGVVTSLLLTSCSATEKSEETTVDGKEALVMAYPTSVDDWYFNRFQKAESDELIADFNRSNDKYIIEKRNYESYDKLVLDIASGQKLDLLYVGDWVDMTPLYGKNLLCDLYGLIDSDSEISRNLYVENVLSALEVNGKLYQMPHDFIVQSAVAKTELWGDDTDTSIEHIFEKSEQLGFEAPFDFSLDSYCLISFISSEFIDFENGTCNFNDGRFEEVLVMMKKFNDLYGKDTEKYPNGAIDLFRENTVMIMSSEFASFDQLDYLTREVGDEIKYVGFPSDDKNYHIAVPIASFSVFESSQNKQGAFEFIKYYTSYNVYIYDTPRADGVLRKATCIPINKAAVECFMEDSLKIEMQFNPNGIDETILKENRKEILNQIYTVNGAGTHIGYDIKKILTDEIPYYLNGDKTVSEVCNMIQNRVTIYISERM